MTPKLRSRDKVMEAKKFSKNVIILLFFSVPASILNYAFSIVLGRLLTVEQFGTYNSMNSLACNLIAIYAPFAVLITRITAEHEKDTYKNSDRYKQLGKIYLLFFVVTSLVGMVSYPLLNGRFGASTFIQWLLILIMIGVMGLHSMSIATIQGLSKFVLYGFISAFVMFLKLILTVVGLQTGGGFTSVIWAITLSHAIIIGICTFVMKRACSIMDGRECLGEGADYEKPFTKDELIPLYGLTFLVQLVYLFYVNGGEVILMNFLCDEKEIGLYSSIVMLAKIAVYLITTFNSALLPAIASKAGDVKGAKGMLYASLIFSMACSLAFVIFMLVFGDWIVPFLWGEKYTAGLKYLGAALTFAIPLANLMVIHTYILGRGKLKFYAWSLCITLVASAVVGALFSANTSAVPIAFGVGMCVCIIATMIYIIFGDKEDEG